MARNSGRGAVSSSINEDRGFQQTDYLRTKDLLVKGTVNPVDAGTALFTVGYQLDQQGQRHAADSVYRQTIELLESLSARNDSRLNMNDLMNLALIHGKNLYRLERYHSAAVSFQRAIEILDSLIVLDTSQRLIETLGTSLNWLARTQRKAGKLAQASSTYRRAIKLWRHLLRLPRSHGQLATYRYLLAISLAGYAKTLRRRGRRKEARERMRVATRMLGQAVSFDSITPVH